MRIKPLLSILLVTLLLSACGSSGTYLAEGGIGGTGISTGPITGFGSIWVNGVRYNVATAAFYRDGQPVSGQDAYRIGEIVTIRGDLNADGVSGNAAQVHFDNALQGTLDQAVAPGGTELHILQQRVKTSNLTLLHGFQALENLQPGNLLQVSGNPDAAGILQANSITLLQSRFDPTQAALEVRGTVSQLDSQRRYFKLGALQVDYAQAILNIATADLRNGMNVKVYSHQLPGNNAVLIAERIESDRSTPQYAVGQEVELEGLITRFQDRQHFSLNGQPVISERGYRVRTRQCSRSGPQCTH
ncbi:MAG: DUF5666 domain-containing protein [Thiolinea sp.]